MGTLDSKLFTDDKDWLSGIYKTTEEAFTVAEYFARYVRKRWPSVQSDAGRRGHLYLEIVDVDFRPVEELERKLVKLGYASDTLQVLLPDRGYSDEQKEALCDFYQLKYAPIVKESHARTNALLWRTFSDDERSEILSLFKSDAAVDSDLKKAVFDEIEREKASGPGAAIKLQVEPKIKPGAE